MMTSADNKRLKEMQVDARTVPLGEKERWLIAQLEAAEATCQSLLDQSSRWEAQALEVGVRIAELEALFALQQTRMAEAVKAWRKATGKQDILPDLGDLLAWLMDRPAAMEARYAALECDITSLADCINTEARENCARECEHPVRDEMRRTIRDIVDVLRNENERRREETEKLLNKKAALEAQVRRLREAAVKLVLPYEALLVDHESRRWLAPTLWAAIEEGVVTIRAALAEPQEGKEEPK